MPNSEIRELAERFLLSLFDLVDPSIRLGMLATVYYGVDGVFIALEKRFDGA